MTTLKGIPFKPVHSTEPSFNSTAGSTNHAYALESTATNRFWRNPSNRAIRLSIKEANDVHFVLGDSAVVATSSGGILYLGGTVESFYVTPSQTHIAFVSSTDVAVNVTLGVGG